MSILILLFVNPVNAQNIGINATGATPDASAGLDVNFTNKGLLVPRVALTATNAAGPVTAPATSLFVYNTATSGTAPNNVTPGYYYNAGTPAVPNWIRFMNGNGAAWGTTGNAGTAASASAIGVAVNNNFIGTTDAQSFVLATNNLERMRVLAGGQVSVNSLTTFGTSTFFSQASGNNNAVDGNAAGTGDAVYGQNTGSGNGVVGLSALGDGVVGISQINNGFGVWGTNTNSNGTGVVGLGNNIATANYLAAGSGGAFTGNTTGVVGYATTISNAANQQRVGVRGIASGATAASGWNWGIYGETATTTSGYNIAGQFVAENGAYNAAIMVNAGETVISNSNIISAANALPRSWGGSIFTQVASLTTTGGRIRWQSGGYFWYVNSSGSADYSEYFNTTDQTLGVGEVVAIDPNNANGVRRARPSDASKTVGVVSIAGTRMNDNRQGNKQDDPNFVNVGMLGQVPVLISTENGNIQPGDALTLSTTVRGRVVKAVGSCRIIGYALTHFPYVEGEKDYEEDIQGGAAMRLEADHVMCYLNPGWYEHVEVVDNDGVEPAPVESAFNMFHRLNKELTAPEGNMQPMLRNEAQQVSEAVQLSTEPKTRTVKDGQTK